MIKYFQRRNFTQKTISIDSERQYILGRQTGKGRQSHNYGKLAVYMKREEAELEEKTPLARLIKQRKDKKRLNSHGFYTEQLSTIPTGEGADHGSIQGALNKAFPKARVYHQGNQGTIQACKEDDANSADYVMNRMDELMPHALILGGVSPSDLAYYRLGHMAYLHSPESQFQKITQQTIIARKRFSHFFQHQVLQSPHIFYEDAKLEAFDLHTGTGEVYGDMKSSRDFRLYRADEELKRKVWLSQLTAARMQCSMFDKQLFFGQASPLLMMEHLAATKSLAELKEIFEGVLNAYKKKALEEQWWPPSAPIDLHLRLKEAGARDFENELYQEQIEFQTSILLRCTKVFNKEVLLLVDHPTHVDSIKAKAIESRQMSQAQATLRDIDQIYTREYNLEGTTLDEQMEKMAILTHIFSRELQSFINFND